MTNTILISAVALSLNFLTSALCNPMPQNSSSGAFFPDTNSYFPLLSDSNMPDGYSMGMATQDREPIGHKSICNTNCQLANPFPTTAGPEPLPAGVFAAAINPALGGDSDDCFPCGDCYSIIHAGTPYCNPHPYDPACGAPGGSVKQEGLKSVKVLITNHCTDCDDVPGHFDINLAPAGWDNPRIYWKKLDDSECL